jgi:hypothetical protein
MATGSATANQASQLGGCPSTLDIRSMAMMFCEWGSSGKAGVWHGAQLRAELSTRAASAYDSNMARITQRADNKGQACTWGEEMGLVMPPMFEARAIPITIAFAKGVVTSMVLHKPHGCRTGISSA